MTYYKNTRDHLPWGKSRAMIHPRDRQPRERDDETYACYELLKKGHRVPLFEAWLYKSKDKKLLITSRQIQIFERVKKLLFKDFITAEKDFVRYVPYQVQKHFIWCWKKGYIKPPESSCHPEWRWYGRENMSLVLFFDGRLSRPKGNLSRDITDFHTNKDGYQTYDGKLVHRLMAKAWFKFYSDDLEVNHKDKNRSNNHIENLEMLDHENNILHRDGKPYEAMPIIYTECKGINLYSGRWK